MCDIVKSTNQVTCELYDILNRQLDPQNKLKKLEDGYLGPSSAQKLKGSNKLN